MSGSSAYATPKPSEGELEPESTAASEDPLVRNGLGSPLCRLAESQLSSSALSNCKTSGFVASSAPSEDYAFDTNIDTTFGISIDALLQDYVVRPIWTALVWLVHALLVALEWSYALDLLRSSLMSGLAPVLHASEAQFTKPWLVSALAFAAVVAAYQGIVRRRVAETLGEAATMLAMIAAAMFVIADPVGTIGPLSQWVDGASVGTFAAVASGSAERPYRALAASMQELYAATIEAPWCFLEFGDVSWCDRPGRLDPRLETAAGKIASSIEGEARRLGSTSSAAARALAARAQLLRAAPTNGGIFLALPANGPLRNSVKEPGSLLYALCGGGSDATTCRGPTAAEAEFRSGSGTLPRLAGVFVIALGVLGMLLLLAFVVTRLLESALLSVLLLLLTPAAALAPTLGEPGRAAFRGWAARLLGAVTSKLLWSMLLGALLATMRLILSLEGLGWLVQWLLSGVLWWGVFLRRRHLLESATSRGGMQGARQSRAVRRSGDALGAGSRLGKAAWKRVTSTRPPGERMPPEQEHTARSRATSTFRRLAAAAVSGTASVEPRGGDGHSRGGDGHPRDGDGHSESADGKPDVEAALEAESPESLQARLSRLRRADSEAAARGHSRSVAATDEDPGGPPAPHPRVSAPPQRAEAGDRGEAGGRGFEARGAGRSAGRGQPSEKLADADSADPEEVGDGDPADARKRRAGIDRELGARGEATPTFTHPVMRDAYEVAQRRKRQLGWSWRNED